MPSAPLPAPKPAGRPSPPCSCAKLKPPKQGQRLYWDTGTKGQLGLSVLVSAGGTKTFRSTFYLDGKRIDRKLGRVGELDLTEARRLTQEDRKKALEGIDPRKPARDRTKLLYEDVVEQFIEHYAKPRQRTWDQTQRVLKKCEPLLGLPIDTISKQDVRTMLRGFIADGHPYKAAVSHAWLKKLWRWAAQEDLVTSPIMEAVSIEIEKRERDRVYSDAEIKASWDAANKLDAVEGAYIKLLMLLAPRRTALACLRRSHLDDADNPTLWTTPWELTKSRKKVVKRKRGISDPAAAAGAAHSQGPGQARHGPGSGVPRVAGAPERSRSAGVQWDAAQAAAGRARRPGRLRLPCLAPHHCDVLGECRTFRVGTRAGAQSRGQRRHRGLFARPCPRSEAQPARQMGQARRAVGAAGRGGSAAVNW